MTDLPLTASSSMHKTDHKLSTSRMVLFFAIWIELALMIGATGWIAGAPIWATPVMIWTPVLVLTAWIARTPSAWAWIKSLDMRWLVGYHLIRIPFGLAFLQLYSVGLLPEVFAVRAGWGDIASGVLALPVLWLLSGNTAGLAKRWVLLGWNLFALADILMVFFTVQEILFAQGTAPMSALTRFPMTLVPLMVVPLILLTHGAIFLRLWHSRG